MIAAIGHEQELRICRAEIAELKRARVHATATDVVQTAAGEQALVPLAMAPVRPLYKKQTHRTCIVSRTWRLAFVAVQQTSDRASKQTATMNQVCRPPPPLTAPPGCRRC